jgi:hypothetical protein
VISFGVAFLMAMCGTSGGFYLFAGEDGLYHTLRLYHVNRIEF